MCVITSVIYSSALNANPRFLTGALVKLCHAVDGLYLSVLPPVLILPSTQTNIPLSAGSLSPVLSTSGVLFEGIGRTVGQYGSVMFLNRFDVPRPTLECGTHMLLLGRYTLSRGWPLSWQ